MTIEQLREFKSAFEKKKKAAFEPVPQLYCKQDKRNNTRGKRSVQYLTEVLL